MFCHVPKTAGSSIRTALLGYGLRCATKDVTEALPGTNNQHVTMQQLKNSNILNANDFEEYFKFCFVRNPWSRLTSQYHYHQGAGHQKRHFAAWNFATSFNFIDWSRVQIPKGACKQLKFISNKNGELLVDKVYKFENLLESFNEIRSKLDLPAPTGSHDVGDTTLYRTNQSEHEHYTKYYNDEIKEMVAEYAKEEIKLFNYTFDNPIVDLGNLTEYKIK